ncbi:UNVERIFIED_CONTAM: hypothetical protein GTU68_054496 [Idotea baltica]|nr:hypothetical protein [Idotea baltica]
MLMGNLTRDPELKTVNANSSVLEMGLAINRTIKSDNGESREEVTYVDVTVWGRTAENVAKYLKKGSSALVEGRLQFDSWQDKATGQNRSKLRVVADSVQFLSSPKDAGGDQQKQNSGNQNFRQAA